MSNTTKGKLDDLLNILPEHPADQDTLALIYAKMFNAQHVYPTLAANKTLTSGSTSYVLGDFVEIVPFQGITSQFVITGINVEAFGDANVYEVVLYAGLEGYETEIGRVRIYAGYLGGILDVGVNIPLTTTIQNANRRISAKAACATNSAQVIKISLNYVLL